MSVNGYQQYKEQSVMTMTSGEMLILLYDELVKRLTRAELALNKQDYDLFDQSVRRCTDIVLYLKNTLNHNYDISVQLRSMYDFFIYELERIRAGRNGDTILELKPLIMELRDAFCQAEKKV